MTRKIPTRDSATGQFTGSRGSQTPPAASRIPVSVPTAPDSAATASSGRSPSAAFARYQGMTPPAAHGLNDAARDDRTGAELLLQVDDTDFDTAYDDEGVAIIRPVLRFPANASDSSRRHPDDLPQDIVHRIVRSSSDPTAEVPVDGDQGEEYVAVEPDYEELRDQSIPVDALEVRPGVNGQDSYVDVLLPPVSASWMKLGRSSCWCPGDRCVC